MTPSNTVADLRIWLLSKYLGPRFLLSLPQLSSCPSQSHLGKSEACLQPGSERLLQTSATNVYIDWVLHREALISKVSKSSMVSTTSWRRFHGRGS